MPYSITREDPERDLRALRSVLSGFPAGISSSAIPALQELADSIEEQVKPQVEKPTGDVVVFVLGKPYWPREGGVHWGTYEHSNNPPTWEELVDGVDSDGIQVYRREEYSPLLQQVRDLLFRSPTGHLTSDEIVTAYKALRKDLFGILSGTPQSDATGALPASSSPEVGVATSPPVASPTSVLVGPATTPPLPEGSVLRSVEDAVVAKRADDGSPVTISDLVTAYNMRVQAWREGWIKGNESTRDRIHTIVADLKPQLITASERCAIDKALAAIKADVENTAGGPRYQS